MNQIRISQKSDYYEFLKALAHSVRDEYSLTTADISLTSLRLVYKTKNIRIDKWPHKLRKVKGAYMVIDGQACVLINAAIKPIEPRIFIMAHELKHHIVDYDLAKEGALGCQYLSWSDASLVEIGAEVFASELIYPEAECAQLISELGITSENCPPEHIVKLKRNCPAPISYTFLLKRLEQSHIITRNQFTSVKFQNLEESIYGLPYYKRRPRRK